VARVLHLFAIVCLVAAAVVVYKVKYGSTYEAQHSAKLRAEIRAEREKIATLRAEWTRLSAPARIQDLATRHLGMKPLDVSRIDDLSRLPEKPKGTGEGDPIGEFLDTLSAKDDVAGDPLGDFLRSQNGAGKTETTGSVRKGN
jgi:cell division protein FtsL